MMTAIKGNPFSQHNRLADCRCCGKKTHSIISHQSLDLCRTCLDSAENQNSHSDGCHEQYGCVTGCPTFWNVDCMHLLTKDEAERQLQQLLPADSRIHNIRRRKSQLCSFKACVVTSGVGAVWLLSYMPTKGWFADKVNDSFRYVPRKPAPKVHAITPLAYD